MRNFFNRLPPFAQTCEGSYLLACFVACCVYFCIIATAALQVGCTPRQGGCPLLGDVALWWVDPSQQLRTHTATSGTGEKTGRAKWSKIEHWGKSNLISEGKMEKYPSDAKADSPSPLRKTDAQPVSEQWVPWNTKPLAPLPSFYCWARCYMGWNWSVWVSCPTRVHSQPLTHPSPTCWGDSVGDRGGLDAVQALFSNN